MRRHRIGLVGALLVLLLTGACGDEGAGEPLVVYTSVTQETVDAVVAGFRTGRPDVEVDVFRAPTGELNARIAAEQREGGVRADVLWLTDPLSMQQYAADGMLRSWEPEGASSVPAEYRTGEFWGTRLLTLVIVARTGLEDPPRTWDDLIEAAAEGGVALPDPGFAGSAFAALGYFALADGYGMDFYRRLHDAGDRAECNLHLHGTDLLASALDDVVRASHEVQEAILVHSEQVASAENLLAGDLAVDKHLG